MSRTRVPDELTKGVKKLNALLSDPTRGQLQATKASLADTLTDWLKTEPAQAALQECYWSDPAMDRPFRKAFMALHGVRFMPKPKHFVFSKCKECGGSHDATCKSWAAVAYQTRINVCDDCFNGVPDYMRRS